MIVEFRVRNFRSILDEITVSFAAGTSKQTEMLDHCLETPETNPQRLLKVMAVYGPNASGKSNILKALKFMIQFIRDSHRQDGGDQIPVEPFAFSSEGKGNPSEFELIFLGPYHDQAGQEPRPVRFQYGFRVSLMN
jgi:hypothetical protein